MGAEVPAEIHETLRLVDVEDAEASWLPARGEMHDRLLELSVAPDDLPEHLHWNWGRKLLSLREEDLMNPFSPLRLMGIYCEGRWQGMALLALTGHRSRLAPAGKDLLSIEYLETAPWNLRHDLLKQRPRFRGCGHQLVEAAVRFSEALGFHGRIGLEALPQAVSFYERLGLTNLGPLLPLGQLPYLEFSERAAADFLQHGRA